MHVMTSYDTTADALEWGVTNEFVITILASTALGVVFF